MWIFVWTNFGFYEEKVKHQGEVVFKWQEQGRVWNIKVENCSLWANSIPKKIRSQDNALPSDFVTADTLAQGLPISTLRRST